MATERPVVGSILFASSANNEFAPFGNLTPEARLGDWKTLVEGLTKRAENAEEKLARLLKMLEERSDCDQDTDGTWLPNEANSILSEYQGWLDGWVK